MGFLRFHCIVCIEKSIIYPIQFHFRMAPGRFLMMQCLFRMTQYGYRMAPEHFRMTLLHFLMTPEYFRVTPEHFRMTQSHFRMLHRHFRAMLCNMKISILLGFLHQYCCFLHFDTSFHGFFIHSR